jgi:hypothetical protein
VFLILYGVLMVYGLRDILLIRCRGV